MPEKKTTERARQDKKAGKSASTQAGEYVRETIEHVREGKHGVRSTKQAIAIGLSKARRAGVKVKPPAKGKTSAATRKKAAQDTKASAARKPVSKKRSQATTKALKKEGHSAATKSALSRQTKTAAKSRTKVDRSESAKKAARTRAKNKA